MNNAILNTMFIRDEKYDAKIKYALNYIKKLDSEIAIGRYNLDDGVYFAVDKYLTKQHGLSEVHRKYIDLQFILEGEEIIYVTSINDCSESLGYNEEKDIEFFQNSSNLRELIMKKGDWTVFYPDDAHIPQIMLNEISKVKKIVVKIPV